MLHASGHDIFSLGILTGLPVKANESPASRGLSVERLNKPLVKPANVARKLEIVGNTQILSNI